MMPNDLLASAVAAARTVADEGADDGAATRLRIRESLAKRGSKRRLWTLLAAAIGTMFASTAFALQAGWEPPWSSHADVVAPAAPDPDPPSTPESPRPRRVSAETSGPSTIVRFEAVPPPAPSGANQAVAGEAPLPAPGDIASADAPARTSSTLPSSQRVRSSEPLSSSAAAAVVDPPRSLTPRTASSLSIDAPTPVAPSVERPSSPSIDPSPSTSPAQATPSPDAAATPPLDPATSVRATAPPDRALPRTPDAELAAYRTAHALHFRGNDPTAALAAWDALLAKFPSGRLAPEARFNRALTLIKLSRWADARAALAPFAAGGYRQREAKQLLDAIADR